MGKQRRQGPRTLAGPVTITKADGSVTRRAPRTFFATRRGRCRICGGFYEVGEPIWAPRPGVGANHKECLG